MALPVKMASLTIKSAAKPLANVFQQWVLSRPEMRRYAISGAQLLHRMDVRITRCGDSHRAPPLLCCRGGVYIQQQPSSPPSLCRPLPPSPLSHTHMACHGDGGRECRAHAVDWADGAYIMRAGGPKERKARSSLGK